MVACMFRRGSEPTVQIRPCAEHATRACHDNCFDAGISIESCEGVDELLAHHGFGEGIVYFGPVEGDDDDRSWGWGCRRVVRDGDLGVWEVGVGPGGIGKGHSV